MGSSLLTSGAYPASKKDLFRVLPSARVAWPPQRKKCIVTIFSRKSSEPETPDLELTFFTQSKANKFRDTARGVFAEMGLEVTMHPGHAVDDSGRSFGFWNVATACNGRPQLAWRGVIRAHLQRVLASYSAPDPFDGLAPANVASQTFARLYSETYVPQLNGYPHREFAPGIVEMLALDLPDTIAVYSHDNASKYGGWEALRAHGISNLGQLDSEQLQSIPTPGDGSFTALLGSSVHTASQALLLPGLATELTGERIREDFGWLMSIPNRHQVVWHIIQDATVIPAVNAMAHFTALGYSDSDGPISPHVFWWNGAGYEQITHVADDGRVTIRVSPEFQTVVESAVEGG